MPRLARPVNGAIGDQLTRRLGNGHGPRPAPEPVPGVCLGRLLTVATFTPRQATTIAIEMFAALARLHADEVGHGALGPDTVAVGTDGVTRLEGRPGDELGDPDGVDASLDADQAAAVRDDLEAAVAIVAELARNADRPVFRHGGRESLLLAGLARTAVGDPVPAAAAHADLQRLLRSANGRTPPRACVHAELAALVSAANRRMPRAMPLGDTDRADSPRSAGPHPRTAHNALPAVEWPAARRGRALWVAAAVITVVALGLLLVTSGPGRSAVDRLLHRHSSPAAADTSSAPRPPTRPRAVPALAPAAAGIVRHVAAHPLGRCAPAASCRMRITVRIRPSGNLRRVDWTIAVYDRCTGVRTTRPGGVLVSRPGARFTSGIRAVRVPTGRALALVAVTTHPARAEAAPVLLPATVHSC